MGIFKWVYKIYPFLKMGIFFANGYIFAHKKNVLSQFFYFVIALGKATFLAKIALSAKMCLKIKNVPWIHFLAKAGRRLRQRMEHAHFCWYNFLDKISCL